MTRTHRLAVTSALLGLAILSPGHAEVYKWVDAQGRTHYGERKSDAGEARVSTVTVPVAPAVPPPDASAAVKPAARPPTGTPTRTQAAPRPPGTRGVTAQSDGRDHGTDASRCALARDVLSGAVRHTNGARTDDHDRQVARNDVQAFCGGR